MGDVLNPTEGTALDCGLFAGGVFKPQCWCLDWPALCSAANYKAAYALAHPGEVYPAMGLPPAPGAVGAGTSDVPAPYTQAEYDAAVNASLSGQVEAWQTQNQGYMNQVASGLDNLTPPACLVLGMACWKAAALGVAAFAAIWAANRGRR